MLYGTVLAYGGKEKKERVFKILKAEIDPSGMSHITK